MEDKYGIKVGGVKTLLPKLDNKTKYIVHYKNIELYLSFEMKLTKGNRILKFKQFDVVKRDIDFNMTKEKMLLIVLKN